MRVVAILTKELEKVLSRFPISSLLFSLYYRDIVKKEIDIANISKEDRVLCIGGGSFPCTALEIAEKTGAYVEVVDIDPVAIKNSKKLITKLKMDGEVKISKNNGKEIDPSRYSVVHIARQAYPHEEILKNILNKASNNTRILLRSSKKSLQDICNIVYDCIFNGKCSCIQREYYAEEDTLLFIKRGKNFEEVYPICNGDSVDRSANLAS